MYALQSGKVSVFAVPSGNSTDAPIATISGSKATGIGGMSIALDATGKIYVADGSGAGAISVYAANPAGATNEAPLATIAGSRTGLSSPSGVALDAAGKIYVANSGDDSITVYAANPRGTLDEPPLATIVGTDTGLGHDMSIAVDARGQIYAANFFPPGATALGSGSVTVYAADPAGTLDETPLATISGPQTDLSGPTGIALDANGKIYVTAYCVDCTSTNFTVYAADPVGPVDEAPLADVVIPAASSPQIAVDAAGRVYVTGRSTISIFDANPTEAAVPFATIASSADGIAVFASPPTGAGVTRRLGRIPGE